MEVAGITVLRVGLAGAASTDGVDVEDADVVSSARNDRASGQGGA